MTDSTVAAFLSEVLRSEVLDANAPEMAALQAAFTNVQKTLRGAFPSLEVRIAGSLAKGTAVRAGHDLDAVAYFGNDDTSAGATLEGIYDALQAVLTDVYTTRQRRSAIRLVSPKVGSLPFTIDVVPGRFIDAARGDVFLHQTTGNKERLKTNLDNQIRHVRDSGMRDVIRLMKVWKLRAGVDVPTFVLELLCIHALSKRNADSLDDRVRNVWTALRDDIDDLKVEDPANPTGNDLTSVLDDCVEQLSSSATVALNLADQGDWATLFGDDATTRDRAVLTSAATMRLGDTSHAWAVPWPIRRCSASVRVVASTRRRRFLERWRGLASEAAPVVEGTSLRFHAHIAGVPAPYEVRWQVVNTGDHARELDGLRGDTFFASRALEDPKQASPDPHVTYESTQYTGKHWIECFVVKDDELWARSGPFYVSIVNRTRRNRWCLR